MSETNPHRLASLSSELYVYSTSRSTVRNRAVIFNPTHADFRINYITNAVKTVGSNS